MMLRRTPAPALRPFVKTLWVSDRSHAPCNAVIDRERVLPTGRMHLAISLSDSPFRVFDGLQDATRCAIGGAIVGGVRNTAYVRDISGPSQTVGAEFHPGACELLFGVRADELAGQHTPLDALWGVHARDTHQRLAEAGTPARQLEVLESILAARLPSIRGLHPAVAHALQSFGCTQDVREVVRQTGYSHRRFIALFRRAVGLSPKRYCRVLRFGRVLRRIAEHPDRSWSELAQDAGYSDQSHFNREFMEFTGITPGEYRSLSPPRPHHVPVDWRVGK